MRMAYTHACAMDRGGEREALSEALRRTCRTPTQAMLSLASLQ
jgi:hypothetical protein